MHHYVPSMIDVDDKIISTDIFTSRFSCDLTRCKGICCVEGNAGAPLEEEEVEVLEKEYVNYKEYMTPKGIEAVESEGFVVVDFEGDLTTPLVDDAECAFSFEEGGTVLCAIEKAYREGKCGFIKPVSCHLYPIRVKKFSNGTYGLNYHRWDICSSAVECGKNLGTPVYKALKEPLERRFGEGFYAMLEVAADYVGTEYEK